MTTYADATLLSGRHRERDMVSSTSVPDRHHIHDRVVGAHLRDGDGGWPACLRSCACGAQVVISTPMVEHVDSGALWPTCWQCHLALGGELMLHEALMPMLHILGCSADARRAVDWLNKLCA